MVKLYPIRLSEASRPILLKGEVERGMLDKVDLQFDGIGGVEPHLSDEYKDGYVVLTNYRLIWMTTQPAEQPPAGVPCQLPLGAIAQVEHTHGMLIKHSKVKLSIRADARSYPAVSALDVERVLRLKLVCKGTSPDSWRMLLETSISRAAWAHLPPGAWQEMLELPASSSSGQQTAAASQAPASANSQQRQPGALRPQVQQMQQPQPNFRPDPLMLHDLCSMGFPAQRAVNALLATNNAGTQQATEWLLEHEGSSLIDMPTPYETGVQQSLPLGPPAVAQVSAAVQRQLSLGSVGISGVLRREEQRAAATEHSLDQAFSDLRQLMDSAQEMVQLAEYFRERMQAKRAGAGAGGSSEGAAPGDEELDAETALDLVNLGIVSPVTRETAGSLYYQELSRQLADFLRGPVERAGGMMPLPDVYCLFNRARGTELVSPDDLLQAVRLFPRIRAGLELREFASGVRVVQAASHSDERVCARLLSMVQPAASASTNASTSGASDGEGDPGEALWRPTLGPAITQTEAAAALSVPVAVASEHLLMAEARGVLCRDEGPEGLRFFRNFFLQPELAPAVH